MNHTIHPPLGECFVTSDCARARAVAGRARRVLRKYARPSGVPHFRAAAGRG
jgi:hypothetical protein